MLYLRIPYDQVLMAAVRQVPGAKWNRAKRLWEVSDTAAARERIAGLGIEDRVVGEAEASTDKLVEVRQARAYAKTSDTLLGKPASKPKPGRAAHLSLTPEAQTELTALEETLMREGAAYATIKAYRGVLSGLCSWWGRPLEEATREDLLEYQTYCLKQKRYSRATMNQVVNAVRAYYERVLGRPKDELQLPRPRRKRSLPNVCSEEEALRMLREVRNLKHRTILTLIYGLGLRKGEVLRLLVRHVDLRRGTVHVVEAKGNKDRILSLQATLKGLLAEYLERHAPEHWLFEGQTGGQYSATSVQAIFTKAKERSGLPDHMTIHGLRHSYATHMVERGTPLHVVKELLGHESIMTTQIYLHTSSKRFGDLYDPLAGL